MKREILENYLGKYITLTLVGEKDCALTGILKKCDGYSCNPKCYYLIGTKIGLFKSSHVKKIKEATQL